MNILKRLLRSMSIQTAPADVEEEYLLNGMPDFHPIQRPLQHRPEISEADCILLRRAYDNAEEAIEDLLDELDRFHGDFHVRGRTEAASTLAPMISELSAYRHGRVFLTLRANAHSK